MGVMPGPKVDPREPGCKMDFFSLHFSFFKGPSCTLMLRVNRLSTRDLSDNGITQMINIKHF